jgi:hypothetical protein
MEIDVLPWITHAFIMFCWLYEKLLSNSDYNPKSLLTVFLALKRFIQGAYMYTSRPVLTFLLPSFQKISVKLPLGFASSNLLLKMNQTMLFPRITSFVGPRSEMDSLISSCHYLN